MTSQNEFLESNILEVEVLIEHYLLNQKVNSCHLRLEPPSKSIQGFSNSVTVRGGGGMRNFAGRGGLFYGLMGICGGMFLTIQTFFKAKNNNP